MANNKCPWMGFKQYEEEDSDLFQGRDKEIEEIMSLINKSDISVCYAQSGAGKSSLIKGGLFRRFRQQNLFPVSVLFNLSETKESQSISFEEIFENAITYPVNNCNQQNDSKERRIEYAWEIEQTKMPAEIGNSLWWKLRHGNICVYVDGIKVTTVTPIFVLDQFERIFTQTKSEQQRYAFFDFIKNLVINRIPESLSIYRDKISANYDEGAYEAPFKLLLALREEYVGRLDYYATTQIPIPSIVSNKYFLAPLSIDGAREVITRQKVTALNNVVDDIIMIAKENQQVSPILLSVVCRSLYEQASRQADGSIVEVTKEDVEKKKFSIIETYYKSQTKKTGISTREIRRIENLLVDDSGTRIQLVLDKGQLQKMNFKSKYKQKLEDFGIIRTDTFGGTTFVELIHDRVAETIAARKAKESAIMKKGLVASLVCFILFALAYLLLKEPPQPLPQKQNFAISFAEDSLVKEKDWWSATLTVSIKRDKPFGDSIILCQNILKRTKNDLIPLEIDSVKALEFNLKFDGDDMFQNIKFERTFQEIVKQPNVQILIRKIIRVSSLSY